MTLNSHPQSEKLTCSLAVIGGGTGGFAAVWAALRSGLKVIVTEEYDRLGGQLTSQAVPPDEHPWIESYGGTASYRQFRQHVRAYYKKWYPLTESAAENWQTLNPGQGCVSALCHEPAVSSAVIEALLRPYLSSGQLTVLLNAVPISAESKNGIIKSVTVKAYDAPAYGVRSKDNMQGRIYTIAAPYFIDATECGDLLPLTKTEYRIGSEAQSETGEPHASETADPYNQQAISWCFVIDYQKDRSSIIQKPASYDFWKSYIPELKPAWGSPLLSWQATHPITLEPVVRSFNPINPKPERGPMDLWTFRRISYTKNFRQHKDASDIVLVNWPQIDYMLGPIIDVSEEEKAKHLEGARQLSLSMLCWMQTDAPREDGNTGWAGLGLRPDITQTPDGLAAAPYIRESRRIKGLTSVLEQHVSLKARMEETGDDEKHVKAYQFKDSAGIGAYRLDLHPSVSGINYIDVSALPFQIPLGALIPQSSENLLAGGKNISVTHITNGCFRLHPSEWNAGESAALCAVFCLSRNITPHQLHASSEHLKNFQSLLISEGIELNWDNRNIYPL